MRGLDTQSGQIFHDESAIQAAIAQGREVARVSDLVANAVLHGLRAPRSERRSQQFKRGRVIKQTR